MARFIVGIDLGGTNIKAGLLDKKANLIARTTIPTEASKGKESIVRNMIAAAEKVLSKVEINWSDVAAVGVGSPGTIDFEKGLVLQSPNLPGFENFPLRQTLEASIRRPVIIENDANAAAFGEYWAGAGRGVHSMVILTLGTGIGGGIILDGKVLHGAHGTAAELGHTVICYNGASCPCGSRGCLEAYASATATVRRFREAVLSGERSTLQEKVNRKEEITSKMIYEAALQGDALSERILRETGTFLGVGIVSIMNCLNPARIVLSGGMIGAGEMLMQPLKEEVKRRGFNRPVERTDIVFASLGEDAGLIGAAGCALSEFETSAL